MEGNRRATGPRRGRAGKTAATQGAVSQAREASARLPTPRGHSPVCALGPEEAGRRPRGGPGGRRWRGRPLRLLRPRPPGESCFLEDND